jgi:hypothetical protein
MIRGSGRSHETASMSGRHSTGIGSIHVCTGIDQQFHSSEPAIRHRADQWREQPQRDGLFLTVSNESTVTALISLPFASSS